MTTRLANLVLANGMLFGRLHRGRPFVGVLVLLLVLVLIVLGIVAIVALFRNQRRPAAMGVTRLAAGGAMGGMAGAAMPGAPGAHYDPVITELRLRYARGEIARDEYMQRAADLGYQPAPGDANFGPTTGPISM